MVRGQKMLRIVAFYLPQFHPIPENDAWWGKGFTEWINVTRARPAFHGHHQPQLPANLGFYDLRLPEIRQAQADLAQEHGLYGFCYYHYWFKGKRLLDRPFTEVLRSGAPHLPFCLCWANESWSRRWLGDEKAILMKQEYSFQDDIDHARALLPAFADPRHMHINGRPVFLIYRPKDLPEPRRTTDVFREEAVRVGLAEPYMIGVNAHCFHDDCRPLGFDHTLDFRPQLGALPDAFLERPSARVFARNVKKGILSGRLKVYGYEEAVRLMSSRKRHHPMIPCLFVGWDNTPRRGRQAIIVTHSTPQAFEKHLRDAIPECAALDGSNQLLFVNAWNEWAEGNYLEPNQKFGLGYLEAVKRVIDGVPMLTPETRDPVLNVGRACVVRTRL
jgi:lipopolysaccharide biosynthesis protein